ncbi:RagB/SusD family nutrient uptake outer membrane protein [Mucilaginibacter sp. BT774]|uniref:RagB/SusD family nutrient uptake outer membrane protein n=1 Tax=Mucilaginibacter sp. BT774 TaxID=3062276 RepID=UPI00267586E2|nr:RagB/SusD family nutrient uptake outer membrane protein [Mucilaginibacter sp. BT774]MDO3627524.1 RagB/SusD family nutrient uptake outer membrane protein [Mucilaginibacter sp. BT774]
MKKYIIYILFIAIAFTACKKSDLDRFPQTSISPNLFFNTENDLSSYVNGLLSMPDRYSYLNDQSSDNVSTTANLEVKNVMIGNATAQNITSGWDWGRLRDINYFLENYNKAKVSADIKNHYAGLAKYYRAMFYMDKIKRFSDVPWYSGTLNPGDKALYKARDPRALVIDSVMADLDFAYRHVNESVPSGTPGKWAVAAFYVRSALYEGTYRKYHAELNLAASANAFLQTAVNIAGDMMTSGKFAIYNTGNPNQDYAALFSSQDLTANSEVILANIFDMSKNRSENVNGVVFGDYEQAPAKDLIQAYLMKDGSRFTDQPNYDTTGFVQEFKNRDPRLRQTIAYPGWIQAPNTTPYIQKLNKNFTGYHQLKGYVNSTDQATLNGVDFPVYRYAEVLLSYAEALAELGTLTQQQLDASVNLIRRRAGMPDLNLAQANSSPDLILQQKYGNIGSNAGVIIEIRRERRVEFAFENLRYDDVMRWHAGKLLAQSPRGIYFPGLGKYDLTGDGIPDIILIDESQTIPPADQKEKNSLGVPLIYYRTGTVGSDATVYLQNVNTGSAIVTESIVRDFKEPKYYYRPIPQQQVLLNPNLKQIFGW